MKKLFYILLFMFPVVAFAQQPWYKYSPMDYAWKNVGNAGFSVGIANWISFAFSPLGQPYLAYEDFGNSMKATVMKFDGTNWVNVGNAGFSAGEAGCLSLAFSPTDGLPYVAYSDRVNSEKATVMRFDGTNWVNVGNAGFSAGAAGGKSLAFSRSGEPYMAYNDDAFSGSATVMKFDGTSWINVGTEGFSEGMASYLSLAFSPYGQPYVAYQDLSVWLTRKATVMKFNGTDWVNVGGDSTGFSVGAVDYTSLAFSPTDSLPYVAYSDGENSGKATVMKFDGTNWVNVGNEGFSAGYAGYSSLAFCPTDSLPYVAYQDWGNSGKATLMKLAGTDWINVGNAGFSADTVAYTNLAFSPTDGRPYVAYMDYGQTQKATVMYYGASAGIYELQSSQISIYPNPATDKITVEISGALKETNLAIVDMEGQQLITRQLTEPKTQIDISNLSSGVYFVRVTCDKTVEVGKVVKN